MRLWHRTVDCRLSTVDLASAAAILALAVAACGTEGSAEEEATKSVREWTTALSEGNGRGACDRMTPAGRIELARFAQDFAGSRPAADCAANIKRFQSKLSPQVRRQTFDADVDSVEVDGDTAIVRMDHGGPAQIRLLRQDGAWRVDEAFREGWRLLGSPSYGMGVR